MQEIIKEQDAIITINVGLFGSTAIDVSCGLYQKKGLTIGEFAALVYPAIKAASVALEPVAAPAAPVAEVSSSATVAPEVAGDPGDGSTRRPIPPIA